MDMKPLICPRCLTAHQTDLNLNFCIECGYKFPRSNSGSYLTDDDGIALLVEQQVMKSEVNYSSDSAPVPLYYPDNSRIFRGNKKKKWSFLAGIYVPLISYLFIIIILIVPVVIGLIMGYEMDSTESPVFLLVAGLISALGFILFPLHFIQRYTNDNLSKKERLEIIGLTTKQFSRKELLIEILFGISLGLLGVFLVKGLSFLSFELADALYPDKFQYYYNSGTMDNVMVAVPNRLSDLIIFVLTILLFVGIPEEVLFRGFVQKCFESKISQSSAILLTAFYFSLFHIFIFLLVPPLFVFLFIPYFGISLMLGYVAKKRKNLTAVIVAHIVYDITEMIIIYAILNSFSVK